MHRQTQQKRQPKKAAKKVAQPKKLKPVTKTPIQRTSQRTITTTPLLTKPQFAFTTPAKLSLKPTTQPKFTPITLNFNFTPLTTQKRFGGWGYSHFLPAAEVEERVLRVLKNLPAVNESKLTPKATFDELGLDSLQQVELIMMLEQDFEVEINDDDAVRIQTVPEAVHYFSHTPYTMSDV